MKRKESVCYQLDVVINIFLLNYLRLLTNIVDSQQSFSFH